MGRVQPAGSRPPERIDLRVEKGRPQKMRAATPRGRCRYPRFVIHLARERWLSKARRARSESRSGSMCNTIRETSRQSAPSSSASSIRRYVTRCSSSYAVSAESAGARSAISGSSGGFLTSVLATGGAAQFQGSAEHRSHNFGSSLDTDHQRRVAERAGPSMTTA